ncbi:MAG: hypothetical protein EAZ07_05140 [Cytophagales bacterium]|nr:MAG: hypothetical protein EAZ07_05140 [Cytophagales bacterium]
MIQQLLLVFRGHRSSECTISKTGIESKIVQNTFQFSKGIYFIQFLVLAWLISKAYNYHVISDRPNSLFEPMHLFGTLFMPRFPSPILFYSVILFGVFTTVYRIFNDDKTIIRILQLLIVVWVDVFQWSFGSDSAVAFILIYSLLFSLLIPSKLQDDHHDKIAVNKMIEYYFLGILITYSFSGLWKVIGILYKLILKPTDVHWLSPNAALYNAVVSYRNYDSPIEPILKYYQYPLFWQMSFLIVLFVQMFCWLAAYRLSIRLWCGFSLIIFHLVNALFFQTVFITAPLVLFIICFPYHLFVKNTLRFESHITLSDYDELIYTKTYTNAELDTYKGFLAFREILYDRNPIWGSLWFVPGARLIYSIFRLKKLIKT